MTEKFATKCFYRENGLHCESGLLYHSDSDNAALLEGTMMHCPACEGKGVILTDLAKEFITFLQTQGRPFIYELVTEILEDKLR